MGSHDKTVITQKFKTQRQISSKCLNVRSRIILNISKKTKIKHLKIDLCLGLVVGKESAKKGHSPIKPDPLPQESGELRNTSCVPLECT